MLALTGDKTAAGAAAKGAAAREFSEESLLSGETSVCTSVCTSVGVGVCALNLILRQRLNLCQPASSMKPLLKFSKRPNPRT